MMRDALYKKKNGIKNIHLIVICFVLVACASFLGGVTADMKTTATTLTAGTTMFEIKKGEGASDIATRLVQNKLITSRISFVTYATFTGAFQNLKPGMYKLEGGDIPSIVRMFTQGPQKVRVVLYPGMTISELDKKLYESGVIQQYELEHYAQKEVYEGFLMPDTYEFHQGTDAPTVVKKMRDNFQIKTEKLFRGMSVSEIKKLVIIASLIEKEVFEAEDRRIVSGIIQRRLTDQYPLQIDAAVAYGACKGIFVSCDTFTTESFKEDTPYNTYIHKGLPPHPIANPSFDALDAALHPTKTSYYFYLSDRATGKTYFSKTFKEHSAKRGIYIK